MNLWTQRSIELANQRNYLDLLYRVYPMSANERREINSFDWEEIKRNFANRDSLNLLRNLLKQDLFPIKDSYVAYLKRDSSAIDRNPNTVNRITGMLYDMGLREIYDKSTAPKETNRQMGNLFKDWINRENLAQVTSDENVFLSSHENMIFNASDTVMKAFATHYLGYDHHKGLDFIGRFNNVYVIAETKFLTDFGGHQNAQFHDAINTMRSTLLPTQFNVKIIAILDGVLYIKSNNLMHRALEEFQDDEIVISAILLREFLYSL